MSVPLGEQHKLSTLFLFFYRFICYNRIMRISTALVMVCLLSFFVSCSSRKNIRNEPAQPRPALETSRGDIFQTGIASWYGDDFHGKTTADGEIYDMHKLTAAHQTLPFHTIVEVENMENLMKTADFLEAASAFFEKRKPIFKGK